MLTVDKELLTSLLEQSKLLFFGGFLLPHGGRYFFKNVGWDFFDKGRRLAGPVLPIQEPAIDR